MAGRVISSPNLRRFLPHCRSAEARKAGTSITEATTQVLVADAHGTAEGDVAAEPPAGSALTKIAELAIEAAPAVVAVAESDETVELTEEDALAPAEPAAAEVATA